MSIKGLKMEGGNTNCICCILYVATSGAQGVLMGSDEREIVLLIYVIVDVMQNKIIGTQQYPICPTQFNELISSQNGSLNNDNNDNNSSNEGDSNGNCILIAEQLLIESTLTDELIRTTGKKLEDSIIEFDNYCKSLNLNPHSDDFRIITDGQLPIRQCLHPESWRKEFELPNYYNRFYDLRKEVGLYLNQSSDDENNQEPPPCGIAEMLDALQMKPECENEFYRREAKDMVNIVQRLINDGHTFQQTETVNLVLEPGILSKDDEIDPNCVVRARGLPWQSSDQDIAKFFRGLNVAKGGVALCLSNMGRRNGEALIRFVSQEHRDMALKRHKHHIGQRYIEVYRATGDDFLSVAGGSSCEALAFLSRGATVIVRMRGLPYDCTAQQVLDFFDCGDNPCTVMDGVEGVLFVRKPDGRATGDAFVLFSDEADAPKALAKHREVIGSRYIELFRSTTAEVQQVLNRSLVEQQQQQQQQQQAPPLAPMQIANYPLLPQHMITSGTRKDCIRLRGLPYEAHVEHILDFLGEYAKSILYQGVHMVYNAQGQPSGEAFIQMDSEQTAFITAQQKHHRYMIYGKKQRYIEVFQCSGEDMNLVLTGAFPGLPGGPTSPAKQTTSSTPTPALLSPGGTILSPPAGLGFPTAATGFASLHFATTAALPPPPQPPPALPQQQQQQPSAHSTAPRQFLQAPIFYWPLYPSPPVSPTGYYMPTPPPPPPTTAAALHPQNGIGGGLQQGPPMIQPECLGLITPIVTTQTSPSANTTPTTTIDGRLLEVIPRPISC